MSGLRPAFQGICIVCTALSWGGPRGLSAQGEKLTQEQFRKISALYQQARSQYLNKDYAKSNETYRQILAALPTADQGSLDQNRARVHYDMGCNFTILGKKKEAIESLERAVGHGYWDHEYLLKDSTLKDLHPEKEFHAVVEKAKRGLLEKVFTFTDVATGKKLEKKDHEGKALILDVWGTWCPPCRAEIPSFVKLQEKYREKGLRIIGLTFERGVPDDNVKRRVAAFATEQKMNYPVVLVGPDFVGSLDVQGYPTTLFVGRDGLVADRIQGLHPEGDLEERLRKLLK